MQKMEELFLGRCKRLCCLFLAVVITAGLSLTSKAQEDTPPEMESVPADSAREVSLQDSLCGRSARLWQTGGDADALYSASMLCGRAKFMSGDFLGAAEVFGRLFTEGAGNRYEAGAWQVRSLLAADVAEDALQVIAGLSDGEDGDTLSTVLLLSVCEVLVEQGDVGGARRLFDRVNPAILNELSCYSVVSLASTLRKMGLVSSADSIIREAAERCKQNPAFSVQVRVRSVESPQIGDGPFRIKLGSFTGRDAAEQFADELEFGELDAVVMKEENAFCVSIGPVETQENLQEVLNRLGRLGISEFEVTSEQ